MHPSLAALMEGVGLLIRSILSLLGGVSHLYRADRLFGSFIYKITVKAQIINMDTIFYYPMAVEISENQH